MDKIHPIMIALDEEFPTKLNEAIFFFIAINTKFASAATAMIFL